MDVTVADRLHHAPRALLVGARVRCARSLPPHWMWVPGSALFGRCSRLVVPPEMDVTVADRSHHAPRALCVGRIMRRVRCASCARHHDGCPAYGAEAVRIHLSRSPVSTLCSAQTMAKKVSSKVRIKTGTRPGTKSTARVNASRTSAQRAQANKDYNDQIAQMSFLARDELLADTPMADDSCDASFDLGGATGNSDSEWSDEEMDINHEDGFLAFPPGEEALLQSHAGGEAVFHKIWERTKPGRGDSRRCRHRVQKQVDSWARQMPSLIDAYLLSRFGGPVSTAPDIPGVWNIEVLGFSESGLRPFVYTSTSRNANETLLRHGYVGGSPDQPTIAFSVYTFEIYRQVHRVCPRFSLEGLAKVLGHLHMRPVLHPISIPISNLWVEIPLDIIGV
ncbi:hypothetical protein K438DRAFT_1766459 [Mycena galopus ATCC 62051]|nr:hypothetical protein K438DRAFT_1766459 [Mycena galopus ATCC 62051]